MADWIDKTGREWSFEEMSDAHLLNTERFLRRQADKACDYGNAILSCGFQGEMASYYADQEVDKAWDAEMALKARADEFKKVIRQRGLTPLETY